MLNALHRSSLLVVAVGVFAGCHYFEDGDDGTTTVSRTGGFETFSEPGTIDENAGSYRGVAFGDSIAVMKRVFGAQRPAGEYEPVAPFRYPDGGYDGPWVLQFGDYEPFGPTFRYYDVVFIFKGREGLGAFEVVEPGAATRRGVAIGDPLESAERAYSEVRCGTVNEDTEYEEYPACAGRLGEGRFIWFGGDPIKNITMSTNSLSGVSEDKPFTGQVFELEEGDFVTFPAGETKTGDKVVCAIEGKRIEVFVPRRGVGVSADPMYVETRPDGSVRAECGGIHAETAPPGSW